MGLLVPTEQPKVSENIPQIIDLVRSLANNPSLPAWRRDPAATRELFTKFDLQRRMAAMGLWPPPGK